MTTPHLDSCPCCGGPAQFAHNEGTASMDSNAGAHWIECADCGLSTNLRYSLMEDCRPLLAECWNRRPAGGDKEAQAKALAWDDVLKTCVLRRVSVTIGDVIDTMEMLLARRLAGPQAESEDATSPPFVSLPGPDTTHHAQWAGDRIKCHSPDQIVEYANARVKAALEIERRNARAAASISTKGDGHAN